jgi:VacB/RNase II family 3'-5' exoribonuclease
LHHRELLQNIAKRAMLERGLRPEFSPAALAELQAIRAPATDSAGVRDLTDLLWASIDNDDSRDLDQLIVAEAMPGDRVKIRVAIADVDSLVKKGSASDEHAEQNTTSVYTAGGVFPMLPEKLSTDLTSLNLEQDRLALVIEMTIAPNGSLAASDIYRASVRNHAKLAYRIVAAWLKGTADVPQAIDAVPGLADNLRVQDRTAQSMRALRHAHGALSLETAEAKPVFEGDQVRDLEAAEANRANELIEDFMISANGVTARYLASKRFPSIRRVVQTPKRWERIVTLAREHNVLLPSDPDSVALDQFLVNAKAADPVRFPDLSLAVIKLLGSGEYVAEQPGDTAPGHFGLAVKDYAHSTAPNRRYADLVTQRLLKAAIASEPSPYTFSVLEALAKHLTAQEDAANKVERQVGKSAAAILLESRIGERFAAIVTGASDKGTWARLLKMPVEGRVVSGIEHLDVGDRIQVELMATDVERGFIDFKNLTL